jgi:3-ketosteroid 9alpha-monooxygenase subunit B
VVEVIEETKDAHSIVLEVAPETGEQFSYKSGQFLTIAVPSDETSRAATHCRVRRTRATCSRSR